MNWTECDAKGCKSKSRGQRLPEGWFQLTLAESRERKHPPDAKIKAKINATDLAGGAQHGAEIDGVLMFPHDRLPLVHRTRTAVLCPKHRIPELKADDHSDDDLLGLLA